MFGGKKCKITEFSNVAEGMRRLYKEKLLPLETLYKFHECHSSKLEDADFDTNPMIMFVGQYSTGKTTLIRYLLKQEYPGSRIGPEPTTDRFFIITYGDEDRLIPGNALVVDSSKPYKPFQNFGTAFLNRLNGSQLKNDLLKGLTIVDTPGILSGEKQSIMRGYDFIGAMKALYERSDMIILLFDAHKLDISDEFKSAIDAMKGYDSKIRIMLNKADSVTEQQLMRVYGALMWSLGKIIKTPEVTRVYIGSFWDQPMQNDTFRKLFEDEENDLMLDIQKLPAQATIRKLNDMIQRARLAKIFAYLISEIQNQMPVFGKEKKKAQILENLPELYHKLHIEYQLSIGDFPNPDDMREKLKYLDFSKFPPLKPKLIASVDQMLNEDVTRLMDMIPREQNMQPDKKTLKGGLFTDIAVSKSEHPQTNPFDASVNNGLMAGSIYDGWVVDSCREKYDMIFDTLHQVNGKVRGDVARPELMKTKLTNAVLAKIWKLSDIDRDGHLDRDEWALCSYLCDLKLSGTDIPATLPEHLIPPSKRDSD